MVSLTIHPKVGWSCYQTPRGNSLPPSGGQGTPPNLPSTFPHLAQLLWGDPERVPFRNPPMPQHTRPRGSATSDSSQTPQDTSDGSGHHQSGGLNIVADCVYHLNVKPKVSNVNTPTEASMGDVISKNWGTLWVHIVATCQPSLEENLAVQYELKYWATPLNLWIQPFSVPWTQVYKVKHPAPWFAFTSMKGFL